MKRKKLSSICMFLLTLVFLFVLGTKGHHLTAIEKSEIEGEWKGAQPGQDVTFIFEGDTVKMNSPVPNYNYSGTFTLDTGADPKRIDLDIKESGIPAYKGRTFKGIYKIEGDILTLALNQPGVSLYPSSFEVMSGAMVFVLKKQD
ncbi:MAG: TIGR03067 domain-containing protein [Candidatus Aminicenantes bacterium]|nr:TIGR03067 domain-containing protein [Candidatus Aminicenantes bacterium]